MKPSHDPGSHNTKPGKPDPNNGKPGKSGHSHGKWKPGRVITVNGRQVVVDDNVEPNGDGPTGQGVRYLRIKNESGRKLKVCVSFCLSNAGEEEWQTKPRVYEFADGETGVLSGPEGYFAASKVRIWVESGERRWNGYKDQDLVLVMQPYGPTTSAPLPSPSTRERLRGLVGKGQEPLIGSGPFFVYYPKCTFDRRPVRSQSTCCLNLHMRANVLS
jgi:hypothetical protein